MPSQATKMLLDRERAKLADIKDAIKQTPAQAAATDAPRLQPVQPEPPPAPPPEPTQRLTAPPPLEPAQPPAAPPAPGNGLASPPPLDAAEAAKLQQRIRTLEGVLETERNVAGPARERKLLDQIAELESKLSAASQPAPMTLKLEDYFTPEQIAEEGVDNLTAQLKAIERIADMKAQERAAPLKRELDQHRQSRVEDSKAQQLRRENQFVIDLSEALPGWETWAMRDTLDPRFKVWLDGKVYGRTRQSLLTEAQNNLDAPAVIEMMQEFLDSLSKGTSIPNPQNRQIPDSRGAGEDPPPPQPEFDFTESQVAKFRSDMSHGQYRKRGKEAIEMMKRIQDAYAKGRIGPG